MELFVIGIIVIVLGVAYTYCHKGDQRRSLKPSTYVRYRHLADNPKPFKCDEPCGMSDCKTSGCAMLRNDLFTDEAKQELADQCAGVCGAVSHGRFDGIRLTPGTYSLNGETIHISDDDCGDVSDIGPVRMSYGEYTRDHMGKAFRFIAIDTRSHWHEHQDELIGRPAIQGSGESLVRLADYGSVYMADDLSGTRIELI